MNDSNRGDLFGKHFGDPRDHGFPNESVPIGKPRIVVACEVPCPHCDCDKTFGIKLRVRHKEIGVGIGRYRGCAACGWASVMVVDQRGVKFRKDVYRKLN